MKPKIMTITLYLYWLTMLLSSCGDDPGGKEEPAPEEEPASFYFGADLSYVNQVLDHGGIYKDGGEVRSPYRIFKDHGANLVRLRLWHNPAWTKEVYGAQGTQLYNDLADVERSIRLSKEQGMAVLLDLHYSDTWADPGKQEIPAAWRDIKDINVLKDSVYQYTFRTLRRLDGKGLMPEMVQVGNETNCGMLYTSAPAGFPACNVCSDQWERHGVVVNSAIKAIRDAAATSTVKTKILLHVADPKNVTWWFDNVTAPAKGNVKDFDILGFSYYPLWHTTVPVDQLSETVAGFKSRYGKPVMILETGYPWTTAGDDNYNNLFGSQAPLSGYPYTKQGQHDLMVKITQEVKDGGGHGVIYWEPAWISSGMKDLWGTGSSWENNTFFDFDGNVIQGMDFMNADYK
jgi:arabinogalactan endo-1,4-beta-galactosidase